MNVVTGVVSGALESVDYASRIIALKEEWIALTSFFLLFLELQSSARLFSFLEDCHLFAHVGG